MITEVLDKNVVAIPECLASQHGIKPGSRLDWKDSDRSDVLTVKVLPDYAAIASSLMGAGCAHLKPGVDTIGNLLQERAQEDSEQPEQPVITHVLDTSAILAHYLREPGADDENAILARGPDETGVSLLVSQQTLPLKR